MELTSITFLSMTIFHHDSEVISMRLNVVDWIALILVIVGGINWGLVAFDFNLVESIFGAGGFSRFIYVLVGIAALYMISWAFRDDNNNYKARA